VPYAAIIKIMKKRSIMAVAVFAAALLAGAAVPSTGAHAVTITNGSFESGLASIGNFTTVNAVDSSSITGWTVSAGSVDYIGTYWTASNGSRSLDLDGLSAGTITQTLTGLTVGQQYQIFFDIAGNPDSGPTTKTLDVMASVNTQSYSFTIVPGTTTHANMGWITESFLFTANAVTADLSFISTTTTGGESGHPAAYGPALDNVRIVEAALATPLPSSLSLMLIGLAGLGFGLYQRTRRQASAFAAA
jgi:choice-of-anchor C domain-containing protein